MSWLISNAMMKDCANLHSLPEQAAESSAGNCSGGEQFAPSNMTPMPQAYLLRDKMTDAWKRFPSGMMCEHLTENRGAELLTLYLAGFRARTSASPEKAQELPENDPGSGAKCGASLAKYDRDSCSWRTRQLSLAGDLEPFLGIWPRWGMMRDGECWEQLTQARRTSGNGSGLWPTPRKANPGSRPNGQGGKILSEEVLIKYGIRQRGEKLWPTPLKNCSTGAGTHGTGGMNIQTAVQKYPTPTKHDAKTNFSESVANRHTPGLGYVAHGGTPTQPTQKMQLNPVWVEWLMGWPLGWTDLHASAMDKYQQWQHSHGVRSQASYD